MPDRIVRLLGQGTFGKVVEATHLSSQRKVAVKIIRAIPKYREASNIEIRVLKLLRERDPANRQYVVARPPAIPDTCFVTHRLRVATQEMHPLDRDV